VIFELLRRYRFEAADRLPTVPMGHRCGRVHGHTYDIEVVVRGPLDEHTGWVIDFEEIDKAVAPIVAQLDHTFLNEVEGLENPTSEHVARWLWERLAEPLSGLFAIRVAENPDSLCIYRGEE